MLVRRVSHLNKYNQVSLEYFVPGHLVTYNSNVNECVVCLLQGVSGGEGVGGEVGAAEVEGVEEEAAVKTQLSHSFYFVSFYVLLRVEPLYTCSRKML